MLVDDNAAARAMLRVLVRVEQLGQIVAEASTSAEANRLAAQHQPNVIVLDLGLRDAPDHLAFDGLRAAVPHARIVIYSAHDSRHALYAEHGVKFIAKSDGPAALAAALTTP